jgi:hypothetical protein
MVSHLPELVLAAVVAVLVVTAGRLRARNAATRMEGTPSLSRQEKIRYAVGFALVAAVALFGLLTR